MVSILNCQKKVHPVKPVSAHVLSNDTVELIKKHLKLQEKIDLPENDIDTTHLYHLVDIDLELGGQLVLRGMKNNGYKIPDKKDFDDKTAEVFNLNYDCKYVGKKKHDSFITYFINAYRESNIIKTEYDYTYDHIFIFPEFQVITTLPLLHDIVEIKDNSLRITVDQNTIARNKYLFNNSRGDLAWLLMNDKEFLKTLVIYFGYDKEEKLNDFVMRDLYKKYSEEQPVATGKLGTHIFVKDCNNKLKIRKGLIRYIEKNSTQDNDAYVSSLSDYVINILYNEDDPSLFTNDEKAEIVAVISNIEIPALNKYRSLSENAWQQKASTLFYLQSTNAMNHPEVLDILKKHDYYGFSFLKHYIESGQLQDEDPTPPQGDE